MEFHVLCRLRCGHVKHGYLLLGVVDLGVLGPVQLNLVKGPVHHLAGLLVILLRLKRINNYSLDVSVLGQNQSIRGSYGTPQPQEPSSSSYHSTLGTLDLEFPDQGVLEVNHRYSGTVKVHYHPPGYTGPRVS